MWCFSLRTDEVHLVLRAHVVGFLALRLGAVERCCSALRVTGRISPSSGAHFPQSRGAFSPVTGRIIPPVIESIFPQEELEEENKGKTNLRFQFLKLQTPACKLLCELKL